MNKINQVNFIQGEILNLNIENIINTTLLGLFFGTFGTTIGGIIGVTLKTNSSRFLSFILQFAAGLMLAIICFELIPEALGISCLSTVLLRSWCRSFLYDYM